MKQINTELQQKIETLLARHATSIAPVHGQHVDNPGRITPILTTAALKLDPDLAELYPLWRHSQLSAIQQKAEIIGQFPSMEEWQTLYADLYIGLVTIAPPLNSQEKLERRWIVDLLNNKSRPAGMALVGAFHLWQGEYEQAQEMFNQAQSISPSALNGLPMVLQLLLWIKLGGADNLKQLLSEVERLYKTASEGPLFPVVRILMDFSKIISGKGKITTESSIWLNHEPTTVDPWHDLFQGLALYWLEQPLPEKLIRRLLRHCKQTMLRYNWYNSECAALLHACKVDPAQIEPVSLLVSENTEHLLHFYNPQSAWRQQLEQIQVLSNYLSQGKPTTTVDTTTSDQRMSWILSGEGDGIEFSPREQKRNKKGNWSKGRRVALKRLDEERNRYGYLNAIDQKICNSMEVTHTRNYSGYPETSYGLYGEETLRAAIGHPALFYHHYDDDELYGPIAIREQEAALKVSEQGEGGEIRFSLTPFPEGFSYSEGSPFSTVFNAPDTLTFTRFSPAQLSIARLLTPQGLKVPAAAREEVSATLSALAPHFAIRSDVESSEQVNQGDTTPHLQLYPIPGCDYSGEAAVIQCGFTLSVCCYPFGEEVGDRGPHFMPGDQQKLLQLELDGVQRSCQRDLEGEIETAEQILQQLPLPKPDTPWQWNLDTPEVALEVLLALQTIEEPIVIDWPEGKRISLLSERQSHQLSLSLGKQRDWFTLEGELALDEGEVIEMRKLLSLLQQRPGRFLQLDDGRILTLSQQLRRQLDQLNGLSQGNKIHPLAVAAVEENSEAMQLKRGTGWRRQQKRIEEANTLQPDLPATLDASLRSYQQEGFEWLIRLAHWGAGGCLADDMGLGKTLQALALILQRCSDGPTLVVAPTSVCNNWIDECQRFTPTLKPLLFGSSDRQQTLNQATAYDLIICSYGLLQSEIERIKKIEWQTIIADEAQAFKNSHTKRSKAMMLLQGKMRIITTGTPIENHLGELWNLFQFINPGLLGSQKQFTQRFATPIQEHGCELAQEQLKTLVRPFMLRRLKRDVLTELPPRTEIIHQVEMGSEEAAFYEALRRQSMERITEPLEHHGQLRIKILTEITRLRLAACHPKLALENSPISSAKLQALIEIIEELRDSGHRALVFSQFVKHLALIREELEQMGINYQYLDGSTSIRKRKQAVDAFQQGEGELFLISLKAGGSGLNLTVADYVIHMDPWWNPAVEDQASDRAHRMGQSRPVTIYRMVVKNSIEEKIIQLHQQKRDLAESLLEGSDSAAQISVDELMALIQEE